MGDRLNIEAEAVRDRIAGLESDGVIEGFHPAIDYEAAGFPLDVLFVCSVAPAELSSTARRVLGLSGAVEVTKLATDRRNLHAHVVHTTTGGVRQTLEDLDSVGAEVEDTGIISRTYHQPFDHFGEEMIADDADGTE